MTARPQTVVFDVNQTLLDLSPLEEEIAGAFGGRTDLVSLWFTTLLQYSLVESITDNYRDFGAIGADVLEMIGEQAGLSIDRATAESAVVEPIRQLPPHDDVIPALRALRSAGYVIVALTNSSHDGVDAQLTNAGIIDQFDHVLSTEAVQAFKPDPRPYRHALDVAGATAETTVMVAAHAWDLVGAHRVGLRTAFVARPGAALYPGAARPDHVVDDLDQLAAVLGSTDG